MTDINNNELMKNMLVKFIEEEDPIQSMMEYMANQLMELEVNNITNASKGEHSQVRKTHRNGYRARRWDTRLGTIRLLIPKVRTGGFQPFFLVNRQQSETALISVIQECFINGVSTRKMNRVLQSFGIENISASQVSNITKELQDQVDEYLNSELENEYAAIWIDALYEKIRENGRVVNKAVMVAMGIDSSGKKVILGLEPMENESHNTWLEFFNKLKKRGLSRVGLVISDGHQGIQSALKEAFLGSSWQRCKVHFMRNILAKIPHKHKKEVGHYLSLIFAQKNYDEAKRIANDVIEKFESKFSDAMDVLSDGLEDSLQFFSFHHLPFSKTSSTNHLERLNREIRRRSCVIGTFPSTSSFLRLIGSYLMEYQEEWLTSNSFINSDHLTTFWNEFKEVKEAA